MTHTLRVALAQLNLTVGDIDGNLKKHIAAAERAKAAGAHVILFPELSLTGYPPEDLLLRRDFLARTDAALKEFTQAVQGIHCIVGHPHAEGHALFNACSLIYNQKIVGRYDKQNLPNYGVFDEKRYFTPGSVPCVLPINGVQVGLVICEDIWSSVACEQAAQQGAEIIFIPNASPFETHKHEERVRVLSACAKAHQIPLVYVNQMGGQDEIVFDGGSMVMSAQGDITQLANFFEEDLLCADINLKESTPTLRKPPEQLERIYRALVLGLKDYVEKNHFPSVILGLSGGIDSALTLAIAVEALGKERVHAVIMPSRHTAKMSIDDAVVLADNLGIQHETISIESVYQSFLSTLESSFAGKDVDLTEQNIQARCRAIILMALSNKFNHLVLTTGNRSELAVGYCTLYGDMAGGFAVLKDVPKTLVYQLSDYVNHLAPIIPQRIIDRPPSAELAPDQKDEDNLPPYSILDAILHHYMNEGRSQAEIIAQGFDAETVERVIKLVRRSEYKRKQAAVGTRINTQSFGKDWRFPITNGFRG